MVVGYHDGYIGEGEVALERKDIPAAQSAFRKALDLDPKNVDAFYNEAGCYCLLKQSDAALRELEKALELGITNFKHLDDEHSPALPIAFAHALYSNAHGKP